jgi:hypothetical protein
MSSTAVASADTRISHQLSDVRTTCTNYSNIHLSRSWVPQFILLATEHQYYLVQISEKFCWSHDNVADLPWDCVSQTGFRGTLDVRGSKRRNCRKAEDFYWRSLICTYELQPVWRSPTLIIPSLTARSQSIAASVRKLPDSVVQSVSATRHSTPKYQAKRPAYRSVWG